MVDLVARYGIDLEAEVNGARLLLGEGLEFCVARWNNPEFTKVLGEELDAYRGATITPELDRELMNRAIAKTIIKGWKGVELEGQALEYSWDNAFKILAHPQLQDLRAQIVAFAQNVDNYRLRVTQRT